MNRQQRRKNERMDAKGYCCPSGGTTVLQYLVSPGCEPVLVHVGPTRIDGGGAISEKSISMRGPTGKEATLSMRKLEPAEVAAHMERLARP